MQKDVLQALTRSLAARNKGNSTLEAMLAYAQTKGRMSE